MFKRRSISEPSLHTNSPVRHHLLPPLTLGDLEDSESNLENEGNLSHVQSLKCASDEYLYLENKSQVSRQVPSTYQCSETGLPVHDIPGLQQSHSGNSYRILKYPSFTSQLTSPTSRTIIDADSDTSCNINKWGSEEFVELVADPQLSPGSDRRVVSRVEPLRQNSLSDSMLSENKENMHFARPASVRSDCTSVTMLNEDAERQRLRILQDHNIHLNGVVSRLQSQLKFGQSNTNKDQAMMKEKIISLKEEVDANEKALRNAEEALERAEMLCEERTNYISELKNDINRLNQEIRGSELSRQSATKNYEEACRDASHLAQQLQQVQVLSSASQKTCEEEKVTCQKEVLRLQDEHIKSAIAIEKLEHVNLTLQEELRDALKEIVFKERIFTEQKVTFQDQVDDLNARFASLCEDLEVKTDELKRATCHSNMVEKELEAAQDNACVQQNRLQSCEMELADMTKKLQDLEEKFALKEMDDDAIASRKPLANDGNDIGFFDDNCSCDMKSPRKLKAFVAELKMKLAAKDAQIQRLEARLSTFSAEADKLENIRGDLINFVERSKAGEKRISQLEGIVLQLEDERSKVTRRVMECEDELNDKKAEHKSLEARLSERTYAMKEMEREFDAAKKSLHNLHEDFSSCQKHKQELEKALDSKTQECVCSNEEIKHLKDELDRQEKALENAADWYGKKEAENKREIMKMRKAHMEQHESMEKEIDRLQEMNSKYKDQTRDMECRLCQLQQQNDTLIGQLRGKHEELELLMEEHSSLKKKSEESLKKLAKDALASAGQVEHLQSSMECYKDEISKQMQHLQSANETFNHNIAIKDEEVAKLKASLNVASESLKSRELHISSLETLLTEKEVQSDGLSEKIMELQGCNSCMKSKVLKLETQLSEVTRKATQEKQYWNEQVNSAFSELTAKNHQFTKLNDALKQVEKEFNTCREELVAVEHHVKVLEAESSEKEKRLLVAQNCEKNVTAALEESAAKVSTLERQIEDANNKYKSMLEKCTIHENNSVQAQAKIESCSKEIGQLRASLQSVEIDMGKKTSSITRLQNALRDTRSSLIEKERHVEELERSLDDRQWELTQRAAQLGKLETTVKEHKSLTEKRNIELQSEVKKAKIELNERNAQLGNLDEQLSYMRRETNEQRRLVEEKDQEIRHLTEQLNNKKERLANLEKAIEESRTAYAECHRNLLGVNQELRVTREKSQTASQQFSLAQNSVESLKLEYDHLVNDLRELKISEKEKDEYAMELIAKAATLETEKNVLEKTYTTELEKLRNDVLKMHQQHRDEVSRLKIDRMKSVEEAKLNASTGTGELQNALKREKEAVKACDKLRATINLLEKEALARKRVLEAANDTIVLKEAEIARLVAKYSYLERGLEGRRLSEIETRENSLIDVIASNPRSTGSLFKQSPTFGSDYLSELFPNSSPSFLRTNDETT